jgi:hypothetical protein
MDFVLNIIKYNQKEEVEEWNILSRTNTPITNYK